MVVDRNKQRVAPRWVGLGVELKNLGKSTGKEGSRTVGDDEWVARVLTGPTWLLRSLDWDRKTRKQLRNVRCLQAEW